MRLLYCNPTGFFAYGEHPYVNLADKGVVRLEGPVGEGKSSFFNAICEILFGTSPPREGTREVTETDIVNCAYKRAFGVVGFEANGFHYRVIYCRDWKSAPLVDGPSAQLSEGGGYSGTSLYFERWDGSQWIHKDQNGRDLRLAKMADTWQRIQEIIDIDYTGFCNSVYVAQDRALQFIRGKNSEREEIVTKLMQLGKYDEVEAKIKEKKVIAASSIASRKSVVNNLINQEQAIQHSLTENPETLRGKANELMADLTRIDERIAEANTRLDELNALSRSLFVRLNDKQKQTAAVVHAIQEASNAVAAIGVEVNRQKQTAEFEIRGIPRTNDLIQALATQINTVSAAINMESKRLSAMIPGAGKCHACGSWIDGPQLEKHKAEQAEVVHKFEAERIGLTEQYESAQRGLEDEISRRRLEIEASRDQRIKEIEAQATGHMTEILNLEAQKRQLQSEASTLESEYRQIDLTPLQSSIRALLQDRKTVEHSFASVTAAIEVHLQRQADRERIAGEIKQLSEAIAQEELDMEEWAWMLKHIPRIKQLKFSSGSEFLNQRIAYYLDLLTDGRTRVVLSPFRVKKEAQRKPPEKRTIDDYIFEFGMTVEEDGKQGVPIQLYSGGERERITMALVPAFWDLASSQSNGCNVLMLDEVITFLDGKSIERIVKLVDDIRSRVSSIILIGHDPSLTDFLKPDETWYARKSNEMTKLEME